MNNSYPTVATILGCPEELKSADGLVATPLVIEEEMSMPEPSVQQLLPNDTSNIKDPVQKAIVDNILGKNPTKASQEKHKCELCCIEVNGKAALLTHLSGARHAKKMKEETLNKESQNPYIEYLSTSKMYHCKLCNATLNARVQIMTHLQGSKHRGKLEACGKLEANSQPPNGTTALAILTQAAKKKDSANPSNGPPPAAHLYCTVCRIYVNSELQLQQHTSSKKHINKVTNGGVSKPRPAPYTVRSPKSGVYRPQSTNISTYTGRQQSFGTTASTVQYQRRVHSTYTSPSYSSPTYSSYNNLSNSFVSSGVYGGNSYNNQPSYNRHSTYQAHTYG